MNVTKPEKSAQATADVEAEIRDLVRAEELSQSKPPSEIGAEPRDRIVPLIQKIVAPSIAEFERLIAELQEARTYLRSESERIQREAARYIELSQTATETVKIISGAVGEWRIAGYPVRNDIW